MRLAHYLEDFADDKGFLQATHQAGLQVEKKKALKQAREQMRAGVTASATRAEERKKEEKRTDGRKQKEEARNTRADQGPTGRPSLWGQPGRWATKKAALKGVPPQVHEENFQSPEGYWRCGQKGHRTYECFAHTTRYGTPLPKAP